MKSFNKGFYISLNPGYTMDIKVSLAGKIEIQVFNNISGKRLLLNDNGQSNPIRLTQKELTKDFNEEAVKSGALEQAIINAIEKESALSDALPSKFGIANFRKSFCHRYNSTTDH